ncbi:17480_t:CDS:1, partial [Gigaspora margarita]
SERLPNKLTHPVFNLLCNDKFSTQRNLASTYCFCFIWSKTLRRRCVREVGSAMAKVAA